MMRRLLAAIFLLLALADISLWLRSYTTGDTIVYRWISLPYLRFVQLYSAAGGLRVLYGAEEFPPPQDPHAFYDPGFHHGIYGVPRYPIETWDSGKLWGALGFYYYHLADPYPPGPGEIRIHRAYQGITFPHAVVLLLLLLHPARFTWTTIRLRLRIKRGLCLHCGYDLRGASDQCPECGARTSIPSPPYSGQRAG